MDTECERIRNLGTPKGITGRQVRLPFKEMLKLCFKTVWHRLIRSIVTVAIVVLAIAFLSAIMIEGYLGRAIRDVVRKKTTTMTEYGRLLGKVSRVQSDEELVRSFAHLTKGSADFRNMTGWAGASNINAGKFISRSGDTEVYLNFFSEIPIGRRVLLVEQHTGLAILDWLGNKKNMLHFMNRLEMMRSYNLPGTREKLESFLDQWPEYRNDLATIRKNYSRTVADIAGFSGAGGVGAKLREAAGNGKTEDFFARLAEFGFHVDQKHVSNIVIGVRYEEELHWAFGYLRKSPVRTGWNRKFQEKFSPGQALESCASSPSRISWIESTLVENKMEEGFEPGRFGKCAEEYRRQAKLLQQEQQLLTRYGKAQGLSRKTFWLISVSFLVCMTGIANAMLMSVLERFQEIATMKCLGALDSTIGFLFVTESVTVGIVGGIVGTLLGFTVISVRLAIRYGGLVVEHFPTRDIGWTFLVSMCCSLLLSVVAAIYPARVAARMAPIEAMGID